MKFSEETLTNWTSPSSDTEQQKIDNTIAMIKDSIAKHDPLKGKDIEIFATGSYANNTNVKLESDMDICIMLKDTFYSEYPKGKSREDYGFVLGTNDYDTYKTEVLKALQTKFGIDYVIVGNKSIEIDSNTYRVNADAVPCFQYRNYINDTRTDPDNFVEGIKYFAVDKTTVINYPKIHYKNGVDKNRNTSTIFKKLVRIFKRCKIKIEEDNIKVSETITSFLVECLLWNVPNTVFNNYSTWKERLKNAIIFLDENTKSDESCKDWGEVSEHFYLFHSGRKWNVSGVNNFLTQMWNYLEYTK